MLSLHVCSAKMLWATECKTPRKAPFLLCWVGAAYATQNLLYFVCLDPPIAPLFVRLHSVHALMRPRTETTEP